MKRIIYLSIFMVYVGTLLAQGPCDLANYTFNNQAAVTDFVNNSNGCSEITGVLTIQGTVSSLSDLSQLTSIGTLAIRDNPPITNLAGLENLTSVQNLQLQVSGLNNADALDNLGPIAGEVTLFSCPLLPDIDFLENTTELAGGINITDCELLTDLNGLRSLCSTGGRVNILSNSALTSLAGLENLSAIGGFLTIDRNDQLQNLDALRSLTSVGPGLSIGTVILPSLGITNNGQLSNLDGLQNLTSIEGLLQVEDNLNLNEFCGLNTLLNAPENGVTTTSILRNFSNPNVSDIQNGDACMNILSPEIKQEVLIEELPVMPRPLLLIFLMIISVGFFLAVKRIA